MTGFGRGSAQVGSRGFAVLLRSLNGRFLDVKVRLPWTDPALETRLADLVRAGLARGRVDVTVVEDGGPGATRGAFDPAAAQRLAADVHALASLLGGDVAAAAILLAPQGRDGPGRPGAPPTDAAWGALRPAAEAALADLLAARAEEGRAIARDLAGHLSALSRLAGEIAGQCAREPERIHAALRRRLARLLAETSVDEQRIAQEAALLAERADVSEEIARLRAHADKIARLLEEEGPIGRKLEFMLQEVVRELNTLAAKSTLADVSALVVEAKAVAEKMREQAQNVE